MPPRTFCTACDNVEPQSMKGPTRYWLCLKHPRVSGTGFVSKEKWDKDSPYLYCNQVNAGMCPLFEPRKETENG